MADITMDLIKKLREKTGTGMALCKEALTAANGNVDDAITYIRKKDSAQAAKKAERSTGQGVTLSRISADGQVGALIEVACETDFVAKNDLFQKYCTELLDALLAAKSTANADQLTLADGKSAKDRLASAIATTGENMKFRRAAILKAPAGGQVGTYAHFDQKKASLVALKTASVAADVAQNIAREVCMHITSCRPMGLVADDIPADIIAREKEVYLEKVKEKPENMRENIVKGMLNKFYATQCLAEQKFVKDEKVSIKQMVSDEAKKAGGTAEIAGFIRFELGLASTCIGGEQSACAE